MTEKFDQLLKAMATKKPLETSAKATQASNRDASENCNDTQTPKGKSEATSSKR